MNYNSNNNNNNNKIKLIQMKYSRQKSTQLLGTS